MQPSAASVTGRRPDIRPVRAMVGRAPAFGRAMARVFAAILCVGLGACFASKEPLLSDRDATFPLPDETRLERVGSDKPAVTLRKAGSFYTLLEPDGKVIQTFRLKALGNDLHLLMTYARENRLPYNYAISQIKGDDILIYYASSKNISTYLDHLRSTNPARFRSIQRQVTTEKGDFFEVTSPTVLETILPDMFAKGYVTSRKPDYRILRDRDPAPVVDRRTAPPRSVDAEIAEATADLVAQIETGTWVKEEDGYRSFRIEFYTRAIFGFSVKRDRSLCSFHFWRHERADDMLNRAYDYGCDGTLNSVQSFSGETRTSISRYEKLFYAYHLTRYAALLRAVNAYKSFNPRTGRLALLPDLKAMQKNRQILQDIVDAAGNSSLMAVRRENDRGPKPNEISMHIWVNNGAEEGGFELAFSARKGAQGRLGSCYVSSDDPKGAEASLDKNCDGTPEQWLDARGARAVSAVGNELVAQSLLLDLGRFASVANSMFPSNEIGPPRPQSLDLSEPVRSCRARDADPSSGFEATCLVRVALGLSEEFASPEHQARYLVDLGETASEIEPALALEALERIPDRGLDDVRSRMIALYSKAGQFDTALGMLAGEKDVPTRDRGLSTVSAHLARSGDFDTAERTARLIAEERSRVGAFLNILRRWLEQKGAAGSERFTGEAVVGHRRAQALALVGANLAEAGEPEAARQTFGEALAAADLAPASGAEAVPDGVAESAYLYRTVAEAQLGSGFDEDARATLEIAGERSRAVTDPKKRYGELLLLSWAYGKAGLVEAALATLDANATPEDKVAGAFAIHDDVPDAEMSLAVLDFALTHAAQVGDPAKAKLADIALAQAKLGDEAAAARTFERALAMARTLQGAEMREQIGIVAERSAEAGRLSQAEELLESVVDPVARLKVLAAIGAARWRQGQHAAAAAALDTAISMARTRSGSVKDFDIERVVKTLVGSDAVPLALRTIELLEGKKSDLAYRWAAKTLLVKMLEDDDVEAALALLKDAEGHPATQGNLMVAFIEEVKGQDHEAAAQQ